jgi:hypothetical protein
MRVFESRVTRRIFGIKRLEVKDGSKESLMRNYMTSRPAVS